MVLNRDKRHAVVKRVVHLRDYKMREIFRPAEGSTGFRRRNLLIGVTQLVGWLDSHLVCNDDVRNIVARNPGDSNTF